jgi:hypothetical protein
MQLRSFFFVPALILLQVTPAAGPSIRSVRLEGARSLDRDMLRAAIATRAPRCKSFLLALPCALGPPGWTAVFQRLDDPVQVERDAQRMAAIYRDWGYTDVRIALRIDRSAAGVNVVFRIEEGEPTRVSSVRVEGTETFAPPLVLPSRLPLRAGLPWASPLLAATEALLRGLAAERGHPYAQIEVSGGVEPATRTAEVTFRIDAGPAVRFGDIQVRATRPLRGAEIAKYVAYWPDQRFQPSRLAETIRRIQSLPIVDSARIGLRPAMGTEVPTTVVASAGRVHGFGVEGTVASITCVSVLARWQHRHVLRAPRVLSLAVGGSNLFAEETSGFPCNGTGTGEFRGRDYLLDAEIWQPALFNDPRTTLRVGLFAERWSLANAFIRDGAGARVSVGRELQPLAALRLSWQPERARRLAADFYFGGNYALCAAAQLDSASARRWTAPLGLSFVWTSLPPPGDVRRMPAWWADSAAPLPAWRHVLRIDGDVAAGFTGSDVSWRRATLEAAVTRAFGRAGELAARIRLGTVAGNGVLPPDARLFAGGVNGVRAAQQSLLGPVVVVADSAGAEACMPPRNVCILPGVDPGHFRLRPLGGDRLLEASIEARLWISDGLQLAGFIDAGRLSTRDPLRADAALLAGRRAALVAPGLGLRARSPLGPIRIDFAYDPRAARDLPLLTRAADGSVALLGLARWDPWAWDSPGGWTAFRRRWRVWLAVGQPF